MGLILFDFRTADSRKIGSIGRPLPPPKKGSDVHLVAQIAVFSMYFDQKCPFFGVFARFRADPPLNFCFHGF